jgi:hypothetical protein
LAEQSLVVVYVYGCSTCGRVGRALRRLQMYCDVNHIDLVIKYTKSDDQAREEHLSYLREAQLPSELYTAIVVENENVKRLLEWNI